MRCTCTRTAGPLLAVLFVSWLSVPALAGVGEAFPQVGPATRAHAVELLRAELPPGATCLTPAVQSMRHTAQGRPPVLRRALGLLQSRVPLARMRTVQFSENTSLRYIVEPYGFDSVELTDADADGTPDVVEATLLGLEQARRLFVDELELEAPPHLEATLVELGHGLDGYLLSGVGGVHIVLDATPRLGVEGARRSAIHQYAHAALQRSAPVIAADWGEAVAAWSTLRVDGSPDGETSLHLERRLQQLGKGLLSHDLELAAGNALWLAFLDEAYGRGAVRATILELGRPEIAPATALDNALRQSSSHDLAAAFREFHLWTLLTGSRADGHHFSFAGALSAPPYSATQEGLPALSVHAEPALGPLGATQIRFLEPDGEHGGLHVRFEGGFGAAWEADLILFGRQGTVHRLPLGLDAEGRGELTVPLDGLADAVLLVRHHGGPDGASERYTYSARLDPGFPFEIAFAEARTATDGVLISWETTSEQRLVGYNVLRYRGEDTQPVVINPVWVPALGAARLATSYHFMDPTAEPDVSYVYRIQGITTEGLSGLSDGIPYRPAPRSR